MSDIGPGDRVICVRATETNTVGIEELVEGDLYVVSWIGSCACGPRLHVESVRERPAFTKGDGSLVWVPAATLMEWGGCYAFEMDRFRRIEHRGMEMLHEVRLGVREPDEEKQDA